MKKVFQIKQTMIKSVDIGHHNLTRAEMRKVFDNLEQLNLGSSVTAKGKGLIRTDYFYRVRLSTLVKDQNMQIALVDLGK